MHAKPDLRVVLKWLIAGSGSVITDVILLRQMVKTRFSIRTGMCFILLCALCCALLFSSITTTIVVSGANHDPFMPQPSSGERVLIFVDKGSNQSFLFDAILVEPPVHGEMNHKYSVRIKFYQKIQSLPYANFWVESEPYIFTPL